MAGGKRISEKRRRRRSLREAALACLEMELPAEDALREELERRGLDPCGSQALAFRQWAKAAAGDTSAARFLRDVAGEEQPAGEKARSGDRSARTDRQLWALVKGGKEGE